jgi:hypothetical protein
MNRAETVLKPEFAKQGIDVAMKKSYPISVNHPGEWGQWQKGVFEVIDPGAKCTAPPILKPAWPKK